MASQAASAKVVIGADGFGNPLRLAVMEHLRDKGGVEVRVC